jgi:hypothetical protein
MVLCLLSGKYSFALGVSLVTLLTSTSPGFPPLQGEGFGALVAFLL